LSAVVNLYQHFFGPMELRCKFVFMVYKIFEYFNAVFDEFLFFWLNICGLCRASFSFFGNY